MIKFRKNEKEREKLGEKEKEKSREVRAYTYVEDPKKKGGTRECQGTNRQGHVLPLAVQTPRHPTRYAAHRTALTSLLLMLFSSETAWHFF